ncbi:MAG: hypothetical protein JW917_06895 [Ignavibacteria bacterium]|nr:hypothetical protein [Ignavibacteria bacterium]
MAKIKIEGVFKQLEYEIKKAFIKTIKKEFPDKEFDERKLYKDFAEAVTGECKRWESIPEDLIEREPY